MPENFPTKRKRFNAALDKADTALTDAIALLDELPSVVTNSREARQLLDAYQTTRDTIRANQRRLEKI